MTITVVKDKGVTVVTMATDSESMLPPLCQILKDLCCSLMCSVYKGLMQTNMTAALGTIQIMVGLFNIGLGPGRVYMSSWDLTSMGAAYWLGGVFIVAGIVSLVADRFPFLCLVRFAVFVNIVGSIFAFIGFVLYTVDLAAVPDTKMCTWRSYLPDTYTNNCGYVMYYLQLTVMDITMIVLAVLQLCVCIRLAVLGFKAVVNRKKEEFRNDVEDQQPQLKEVLLTIPGA
ncbi:uncharacterized protein LOC119496790 [Sebastes umbrosus]|uniref:uncharacterized protein LOC119496790 n=1 Tax=Sebastes umbrosus TaxID=72105 RepID=UPI00189CD6C5|nr:uncharacterized protein LOC119496790 [Sebastes umbrosus]